MLRITREKQVYSMAAHHAPVAKCEPGSTVIFETKDAYAGFLKSDEQLYSVFKDDVPQFNPAAGPLYVEGAKAGDILRVEIIDIKFGPKAAMCVAPGILTFGDVLPREQTKVFPVKDGKVYYNDKITLDVRPMVGVIGTAPAEGEFQNMYPGPHGANMDCTQIAVGSVVYLPVCVAGALLLVGDLHAVMGDGETCGCAAEIDGEVTVKVDLLTGRQLPLPLIKRNGNIITVASAETMQQAAIDAAHQMYRFLDEIAGFEGPDAAMLISLEGQMHVCQIVNPLYTMRMEFPISVMAQNGYNCDL